MTRRAASELGDNARMPRARTSDLIVTRSGDELIVYDLRVHHIHQLDRLSAMIWKLCDGSTLIHEVVEVVRRGQPADVTSETVMVGLSSLRDANLLEGEVPESRGPHSRRRFLQRSAKIGAAAMPAIVSTTAPLASASASTGTKLTCTGGPIDSCASSGASRNGICCRRAQWPHDGVCREGICVSL